MFIEFDKRNGAVAPHGSRRHRISSAASPFLSAGASAPDVRPQNDGIGSKIDRRPPSAQCLLVCAYLGGLSMSLVDLLPSDARLTAVPAGELIFAQGDRGDKM